MANSIRGDPTAVEALSSDIRAILLDLVGKLDTNTYAADLGSAEAAHTDQVLLDVEVGDVRLLALRRGHPSPVSLLSPREHEIARMVAQGYANKTIASVLEISTWTVASHLRRIFVKLRVSSRAAMVACLSDAGLNALVTRQDEMGYPRTDARSGVARVRDGLQSALVVAQRRPSP